MCSRPGQCGLLAFFAFVALAAQQVAAYKPYTGWRVRDDSIRMVYFYEQTIAVVELGPGKTLLNCEIIEVYKPGEQKEALKNLTKVAKPYEVSFAQMMDLMTNCEKLGLPEFTNGIQIQTSRSVGGGTYSLLSGVLPGTRWCGTGDLATTFFDLGTEMDIDKCCRTHDLCPVKVRGHSSRYSLDNNSPYTRSHCHCDAELNRCLKKSGQPTADIMGNIYFNLLKLPCVQTIGKSLRFQNNINY